MQGSALVPALYLPPAELMRQWIQHDEIVIDTEEFWVKQTLRNRTYILGANGVQSLSVPVQHTGGKPTLTKDIRISYNEPWIRIHKGALFSAYNTSPFFEFFRDDLFGVLDKRPVYMLDLNISLTQLLMKKCRYSGLYSTNSSKAQATDYTALTDFNLLKAQLSPSPSYPQVFSYKHPFAPYLSAVDMLSNLGRLD